MLYREIIAVCSEIHTKHIIKIYGQNVELMNAANAWRHRNPTAVLYFPGTRRVTVMSLLALNYMTHIHPRILGYVAHFLSTRLSVTLVIISLHITFLKHRYNLRATFL